MGIHEPDAVRLNLGSRDPLQSLQLKRAEGILNKEESWEGMSVCGRQETPGWEEQRCSTEELWLSTGEARLEDAFKEDRLDLCELKSRKGPPRWSNVLILRTENPDLVSLIDLRTVSTMAVRTQIWLWGL